MADGNVSTSDTAQSLYRCTPRQVRAFMCDVIEAGLVPYVRSSPGMGKSSITHGVANEFRLKLMDERLSTRSPVDLSGLPDLHGQDLDRRASFTPFDTYPVEGTELPKGKEGWLLFLDEFNSAPKAVQAAAYKLILDRMVGLHKLHPNVAIVCAGNLETDRAITNPLSTAMQSRLVHLEMVLSFEEWLEDVALKQKYDPRIIAYLNYCSGDLMDFRPDHNEKTFCCPRTWEFMNRLVQDKEISPKKTALYAGTITSGVAVKFVNFMEVYSRMPDIKAILANPETETIPSDSPGRWAVISHLMDKVTDKTLGDVSTYVGRMPLEYRILFGRGLMVQHPAWRTHPAFAKSVIELSKYLNDGAA